MAKCVETLKACQQVEERKPYGFNWTKLLSRLWSADTPFTAGTKVRPLGDPTGFQYSSAGGQSGNDEPAWPTSAGGTVVDGSITWTAEAIAVDSLADGIDDDTWLAPAGVTVTPESPIIDPGLQRTSAIVEGGTAGQTYTIDCEMVTDDGLEYVGRLILSIVE